MKNYALSAEAMVMISGSSIGTQPKYYENGWWYKANQNGYEALAEYLSGIVLACSNVSEYVTYELCTINGRPGCRSRSFLTPAETFISFQRLYDMYHGGALSERILMLSGPEERIAYVTDFVLEYTGVDCRDYISKTLSLDCLILNTDRHFNNLGIIADRESGKCRCAPIFDNGDSLLSSCGKFSPEDSLETNISKACGQPFSANLELQAQAAGLTLKLDYKKLKERLKNEPPSRTLSVLMLQLDRYEGTFSRQ